MPRSAGRAAFAARSRLVLAAAVAGSPGGALVAFPSGPCPAVCSPAWGAPVASAPVSGGGSGSWLAVALAVGAGLPVALFLPAGVALPCWAGGSWARPAVRSGVWSVAWSWVPGALPLGTTFLTVAGGRPEFAVESPSGDFAYLAAPSLSLELPGFGAPAVFDPGGAFASALVCLFALACIVAGLAWAAL